jgi:hypothetical protein
MPSTSVAYLLLRRKRLRSDIIKQRILWIRIFVINQPEGIRHILLDNAANYTKSEVGRRVLEPALGRGLLTSEGGVIAKAEAKLDRLQSALQKVTPKRGASAVAFDEAARLISKIITSREQAKKLIEALRGLAS